MLDDDADVRGLRRHVCIGRPEREPATAGWASSSTNTPASGASMGLSNRIEVTPPPRFALAKSLLMKQVNTQGSSGLGIDPRRADGSSGGGPSPHAPGLRSADAKGVGWMRRSSTERIVGDLDLVRDVITFGPLDDLLLTPLLNVRGRFRVAHVTSVAVRTPCRHPIQALA